jgi:hypothetical protein
MHYFGRQGSLWYGGLKVAKVRDWELTSTLDLLETTTIDAYAPTFRPGRKDSSGSATLLYYRLDQREKGLQQQFTALLNKVHRTGAITVSDLVRLELRISDRSTNKIICDAWITSATLGTAAGELASVPVEFQVQGDLIEAIR